MVAFIFNFDLRKSHSQVKLHQIFKLKNFLQKHAYLVLWGGSLWQKFSDIFGIKIFPLFDPFDDYCHQFSPNF